MNEGIHLDLDTWIVYFTYLFLKLQVLENWEAGASSHLLGLFVGPRPVYCSQYCACAGDMTHMSQSCPLVGVFEVYNLCVQYFYVQDRSPSSDS